MDNDNYANFGTIKDKTVHQVICYHFINCNVKTETFSNLLSIPSQLFDLILNCIFVIFFKNPVENSLEIRVIFLRFKFVCTISEVATSVMKLQVGDIGTNCDIAVGAPSSSGRLVYLATISNLTLSLLPPPVLSWSQCFLCQKVVGIGMDLFPD